MSFDDDAAADRLAAIRRRVRRLVWWSGLSLTLTALFGSLLAAGSLDWLVRLDDVGLRVLLAALVWSFVGWTTWRTLCTPLRAALSDSSVAAQVDRRYPGLSGRCQSAAEFAAGGCDARWGSAELQALVVRQARADLSRVEPTEIVDPGRMGPALWTALMSCLIAGAVLFAYPLEAATAVRRLIWPWGNQPWPRTTVLALINEAGHPVPWDPDDPLRAVRGETLRFSVEATRGPLPAEVWWEVRAAGQAVPETHLLRQEVRDLPSGSDRRVAVVEWPVAQGPIEFRAVGGDDDSMAWHRLLVVDPPTLESFAIVVTPPAYSGQPPQTLPPGATQVRGLIGSRVKVTARSTKPLRSVSLAQRETAIQSLTLAPDGRSWTAELTITQPGTSVFWFILQDRQGFQEQQPLEFELRGEIDALPDVTLTEPDADRLVTPDARLPLAISAQDDRGLTRLQLAWQRGDNAEPPQELRSWTDLPLQATFRSEWSLGELQLQPGDRVVFRAEALDACDIGEPHIGKSAPRTLLVVSTSDKMTDLTQRTGEVLDDLQDAAQQQARLKQQAAELLTQLETVGELRPEDRDLLKRLQFDQRRLNSQLADTRHGLGHRARRIRAEFGWNGLSDNVTEPQLDAIADELDELSTSTLPQIEQHLTEAAKLLDGPQESRQDSPSREARDALDRAARGQQDVLEALLERQEELDQWQSERELISELQSLLETQQALNRETAELGSQTVTKALAELPPQQLAELAKLAARQRQQADRLRQFRQNLERQAEHLEDEEPARAAELAEAAEQLAQKQLDVTLRQAADDLSANRIGAAGPVQQAAEESLQQMQQAWNEQRPDDAEQLAQKLQKLESETQELVERAETLQKRAESENLADADRELLRRQADELRRDSQRLERQLERMRMRSAAESARRAAQDFDQAEAALEDGDDPEQLRKHVEEAEAELASVQEQLRQERRQAQARLAQEEYERIASQIESLKTRQEAVVAETVRLETQRQETGRWTRGQLRSLQDLAVTERELGVEASKLRDQVAAAVVAKAALQGVVRSLERATERLSDRQTDAVTQQLERDAAQRLNRILTAWNRQAEASEQPADDDQPPLHQDQPEQSGPPGEAISAMVQLALLRELQADCLDRTVALEQQRKPDGTLPDDLAPLLADLAEEQENLLSLAKALIELVRQPDAGPEPAAPETQP